MKTQFIQDKAVLMDKSEEMKKLYGELQNELLESKINYEKTIALSN